MNISLLSSKRTIGIAVIAAGAALALLAGSSFARTTSPAPAPCSTSKLVVWLDTQGSGAAGSVYYKLHFTNLSGHRCRLSGYPGVSAVDLHGKQLGSAASRIPAHGRSLKLAPGATATAVLQIAQVVNFTPSACRKVTAAGLRVYPPNQRASKIVPFPFDACSRRGPVYLHVKPVT